jgi:ubiquinone/menaquinone biosynthesis C-methylase UbiE
MSDKLRFWESWSPYWSYIEDNYLDLDSIDKLSSMIKDPALVIGAGQGILVEQLRKKGLIVDGIDAEPEMVAYAKKRRNLDIILANGKKMPIDDNTYQTSIIATGVIDFLDDEEQIRSILNEAMRVTEDNERVFIAFYRFQTQGEELMRYLGLLTDESRWRAKRMYEVFRLKLIDFLKADTKEANVSFVSAFFKLVKLQMRMPRKEKEAMKRWSEMWKEINNHEELIASVPDSLPYRNEESIRILFENLDVPIKEIFQFTSCFTVQI